MTPKGRKILFGILIAAGCVVAVGVALVVTFVMWVTQPGAVVEPRRLLSADATGYAEWTLRLDDPGTEGFLELLIEAVQKIPPEVEGSLPPFAVGWMGNSRDARARGDLEDLLPAVASWTLRPAMDGAGRDVHLVGVSARGLGNQIVLADWIAGFALERSPNTAVNAYNGENIYQVHVPERNWVATFFARRGAVFATSDLETARQAVDLLAQGEADAPNRAASGLETLLATPPGAGALRAAVTNEHDELAHLWERLSGEAPADAGAWRRVQGATLTGGVAADGSFAGTMTLITDAPEPAAAYAPAIAPAFRAFLAGFALDADITATAADSRIVVDVRVPDLVDSVTDWMQEQSRPRRSDAAARDRRP